MSGVWQDVVAALLFLAAAASFVLLLVRLSPGRVPPNRQLWHSAMVTGVLAFSVWALIAGLFVVQGYRGWNIAGAALIAFWTWLILWGGWVLWLFLVQRRR